jgi:hypothetical protein
MVRRLTEHDDDNDPCLCCGGKKEKDEESQEEQKDEEQPEPSAPEEPPEPVPPPVEEDVAPVVVAAAAAVPAATQTSPRSETEPTAQVATQTSVRVPQAATQTAPVEHVVTDDAHSDNVSQVSSTVHPSGVSAVTMPTYYDVSIYDGDMFFDSGGDAKSV